MDLSDYLTMGMSAIAGFYFSVYRRLSHKDCKHEWTWHRIKKTYDWDEEEQKAYVCYAMYECKKCGEYKFNYI